MKIYDTESDIFYLQLGIPQGSSLGTTFFSIGINATIKELESIIDELECPLYVDDAAINKISNSKKRNNVLLNQALNNRSKWSNQTNLRISLGIKIIHFHRLRNQRTV